MKVFNWVNKRLLHVHSCTTYTQGDNGLEKSVRSKIDVEKHALLDHDDHVIMDMFNDWRDAGILAIGTLAIGPLDLGPNKSNDYDVNVENNFDDMHDDPNDDHYDDDDFEASPLMKVEFFSHELEKCKNIEEKGGNDINIDVEEMKDINGFSKNECEIKRRVTLADLFYEDSDHHIVNKFKETNDAANNIIIFTKQPNLNIKPFSSLPKHGLCQAKKFFKEELSPLKKLNQLMKRMMKKKIHPDLEGKTQKDIQMQPSNGLRIPTNDHEEAINESASLLLIQDSIA